MTRAAYALPLLALPLILALSACEPCAFVVGGHCEDRQHDEQQDQETKRPPPPLPGPTPLWPAPRARGSLLGTSRHG